MKKLISILSFVLFFVVLSTEHVEAQKRYKSNRGMSKYKGGRVGLLSRAQQYTVIGVSLNSMNYFGDLSPLRRLASTDASFTRPGFGLTYGDHFNAYMTFRAGLSYGRIIADDFDSQDTQVYESLTRYARNAHFRNDIIEFSMGWEIDLIPNYKGPYSRPNLTPFIYFGGAVLHHEPKAVAPETAPNGNALPQAGDWVKLRPLGTEGQYVEGSGVEPYKSIAFAIPLGLGLKFKLPNNFNAVLEFGYRYVFTDYLDDVSGKYVDLGSLGSDLSKAMSDRSAETIAARANVPRDISVIEAGGIGGVSSYISSVDGQQYTVIAGYGSEGQIRGNKAKDLYFVTQIRLNYLLTKGRRPGYRR
jgi:hypothetical protein